MKLALGNHFNKGRCCSNNVWYFDAKFLDFSYWLSMKPINNEIMFIDALLLVQWLLFAIVQSVNSSLAEYGPNKNLKYSNTVLKYSQFSNSNRVMLPHYSLGYRELLFFFFYRHFFKLAQLTSYNPNLFSAMSQHQITKHFSSGGFCSWGLKRGY